MNKIITIDLSRREARIIRLALLESSKAFRKTINDNNLLVDVTKFKEVLQEMEELSEKIENSFIHNFNKT